MQNNELFEIEKSQTIQPPPFVASMHTNISIPADLDYKKVFYDHSAEKYR
jgi:hypothetical protein